MVKDGGDAARISWASAVSHISAIYTIFTRMEGQNKSMHDCLAACHVPSSPCLGRSAQTERKEAKGGRGTTWERGIRREEGGREGGEAMPHRSTRTCARAQPWRHRLRLRRHGAEHDVRTVVSLSLSLLSKSGKFGKLSRTLPLSPSPLRRRETGERGMHVRVFLPKGAEH